MSNVYFSKIDSHTTPEEIQKISRRLLDVLVKKENIKLEKKIPLKVHFGEMGNLTFIKPENYLGIIGYLQERNIESCYMETTALYGGKRNHKKVHLETAEKHGFTQLPVIIADGEQGELFTEVEINKKHYQTCKIGSAFLEYPQLIVISHFKGHAIAGFGGALKQLSMGHASKGGKLAMHMGVKPHIVNRKCEKCKLCMARCNENAITIGEKSFIDHDKCVGCGACIAICPHKAVSIYTLRGIYHAVFQGRIFREKMAEYAYAAQKDKKNIYFNFAMNITKGCDCEPKPMKSLIEDFGIFISTDPVAIDKATLDLAKEKGKTFRGTDQLDYAEKIGLGSTKYALIEV
jgi:uncharacterized Fe-S center protein